MNAGPENYDEELNEVELGRPSPETQPQTSLEMKQGEEEDGVLDQVFNEAERLCCGIGKGKSDPPETNNAITEDLDLSKNAPEAPETEGDHDTERVASFDEEHVLMTESPDDEVAVQPDELSEPNGLAAKESVEIQAHFDKEDVTITSDNGVDNSGDSGKLGFFVSGDKNGEENRRRKPLMMLLLAVVLLVFIIGLSAGLARKNKRDNESSVVMSAAKTEESMTDNSGTDGAASGANVTEAEETEAATSAAVPSPTTDTPIDETSPPIETSSPIETSPPIETPPECVDSISADSLCYGFFQDEVIVTFNLCEPVSMDWVAIYPEGSDMNNLGDSELPWQYSCGTQECVETVQQDNITMGIETPPGRYQAYLVSNIGGDQGPPYVAIASSAAFEITVGSCD